MKAIAQDRYGEADVLVASFHEGAHEGHHRATQEERDRDDEGEAPAIEAEIGRHRLEEGTHREADAGGEEDDDGDREGHPPAVEDARLQAVDHRER